MSEQDLIKIVEEHLAAYAALDWERYKTNMAPDAIYEQKATQERVQGPDQIVEATKGWKLAYPDLKLTIKRIFAAGNTVVVEGIWEGTHTGPLAGPFGTIAPTGKFGTVPAAMVFTFEDGKIKEAHQYFDLLTVLRQIGAVPMPAAAAAP